VSLRPYRLVACFLVALQTAASPLALAAGSHVSESKTRGDALFDARNYAGALEEYRAALAQGGDARLRYNIAQTLTALERYPEALASYQAFLAEAPAGTLNAAQQEKFFQLLDELKWRIARIEVHCPVAGARVLLRNTALGTTPLDGPVAVNAGPARIEILAEGFKPFVAELNLGGGSTQAVDAPLERIDFTGALAIQSNVAGARVAIDGVDLGETPRALRLEQGAHVVSLRAGGYVTQSKTVTIEAGVHLRLSFTLERAPDYTLAWVGFGTGLVGVAVGSVTGVLAFTTFSSAKGQCDTSAKECGPAGQPDLQSSKTYGVLSTVAFGVGAAGVGLGVFGLVFARRGHSLAKPAEVVLLPGKLVLEGSF
jgi:PEGA domain